MEKISNLISQDSTSEPSCSANEVQRQLVQIRIDAYNDTAGKLTGHDCPKCKNRGNFAVINEDGDGFVIRDCSCMKIRRCVWKMERSGLDDVIRTYTFERFDCKADWQKTLCDRAKSYAANPQGWFLLCGQTGAGKTHLCVAICRELLLSEHEVFYMPWRQDISELKALSFDNAERAKRLQQLKSAEVLYIDDLFKTGKDKDGDARPTRADVDLAFEILNYRYTKHLPTIISTERSPKELLEIDQAIGGRITERAASYLLHVGQDIAKNYRLRNVIDL